MTLAIARMTPVRSAFAHFGVSREVPTAEMHDRDQDAETVLAALRMTSRTTPGFDSMGT